MADAESKDARAVPPMKELLETLTKRGLLTADDSTVLESMSIDSDEITKITIIEEEANAEEIVEDKEGESISQDAKSFALTLYYYSPEAYNYICSNYDTCLPSVPELKPLYKHKGGVPGFTEESLIFIEEMAKKSDKKIYCSLTLRELDDYYSMEQYVDGDGYYGFENIGSEIDTDCQNRASTCLIFSVAAINGSWNVPVGYFLLYFNTAEKIARLVNIGVDLLEKCNVNVIGLSFPAQSTYQAVARTLGCNITADVSNLKTTFESEGNNRICVFPDCKRHAGEEICMVWREAGQTFKDGDGNSIVYTYVAQLKEGSRTVKKKIYPFSKDITVKLMHNKDTLKSPSFANAGGTINFINYVIEALDIFSSKEDGGGLNRAVNQFNKDQVIERLDAIIEYFSQLQEVQHVHFIAFCIAAESAKELIKHNLGEDRLECIPFYKITSQPAEEFIVKLKRRAGPNYNAISAYSLKKAYNAVLRELKIIGYK